MHSRLAQIALALVLPAFACGTTDGDEHDTEHDDHGHDDDGHGHGDEIHIVTVVELTFTPSGGGDAIVARFSDPDGDGGMSGTADPISLAPMTSYQVDLEFLNELEEPTEDITVQIADEAEQHLVMFGGTAPYGNVYGDVETDYAMNLVGEDMPVGLTNTITTDAAGAGTFRVMLRHLPELNGSPQKTAGLDQQSADDSGLPGDVDADVTFDLTVE